MFKKLVALMLIGVLLTLVTGCSDDDNNPTGPEVTEYEVLQPELDAYTGGSQGPVIKAADLYANMNDGDTSNDYFVVSVRAADAYALGHIPGAINIPWRTVGKAENLTDLPTDKKIAVYCYTGHTGGIATTILNTLGYEAYNLKFGMTAWTKDATVRATGAFNEETEAHDYTVETTVNAPSTFDIPTTEYTTSTDNDDILYAAADACASTIPGVIKASDVFNNLNDGDTSNDPQIISVRSEAHYQLGHIPGAINIPWREIAKEENLKKVDPSRQVVVYCYTGHTGAVATTALKMLGYDAVNMKFGIYAWTKDATVRAASGFSEETEAHDYPTTPGTNP